MSCQAGDEQMQVLSEPGVSKELATFRSEKYLNVSYSLSFNIPEEKNEPVTGVANILWDQGEKLPLIIDFRGDSSQIISVMLNREPVEYKVENEHIILPSSGAWSGKNMVSIAFRSSDQSLNRRDEFLYTLLVPDRARTLFPCFDQPDIKARYSLELIIPETWKAVANGKIAGVDSLSHPGRHVVTFQETEPLPTYLFSLWPESCSRRLIHERIAQFPFIIGRPILPAKANVRKLPVRSWMPWTGWKLIREFLIRLPSMIW